MPDIYGSERPDVTVPFLPPVASARPCSNDSSGAADPTTSIRQDRPALPARPVSCGGSCCPHDRRDPRALCSRHSTRRAWPSSRSIGLGLKLCWSARSISPEPVRRTVAPCGRTIPTRCPSGCDCALRDARV